MGIRCEGFAASRHDGRDTGTNRNNTEGKGIGGRGSEAGANGHASTTLPYIMIDVQWWLESGGVWLGNLRHPRPPSL